MHNLTPHRILNNTSSDSSVVVVVVVVVVIRLAAVVNVYNDFDSLQWLRFVERWKKKALGH